jgi:CRP-like cAMP-binding protein
MPTESAIVGTVGRLLALAKLPMLATLPTEELKLIAERSHERFFPRGSALLREGEPIAALRFVIEGRVHMSRRGLRLGHGNPGAAVGGLGVLAREGGGIDAIAEQDTLVLELDADEVIEILEDRFAILYHILREMAAEIVRLAKRLPPGSRPPFPRVEGLLPPRDLDFVERILFLRESSAFSKSSINALAELSRGLSEVSFDPGVTLWREGEASAGMLLLLSGRVRCTRSTGLAFEAGPGVPLGSVDSVAELPRWFHALTETHVVALYGDREGLIDVLEDNTEMAFDYLAVLAKALLSMLETMAEGALERFYGCDDPNDAGGCGPSPAPREGAG